MIRVRAQATLSAQGIGCSGGKDIVAAGFTVPPHAAWLKELFGERTPRRLDRLSELVLLAAGTAVRDAALDPALVMERAGVYFATGQGNFSGTMTFLEKLHEKGARFASPIEFPNLVISAPAGSLSFQLGFKGEVYALNQGGLSGLHALISSVEALTSRRLDVALVAGAEEHSAGRARSAELLREPGITLGEGAAALVLDRGDDGVLVRSVAMNGLSASDGLVAAAKHCLQTAGLATADVVVTHKRHVATAQRFGGHALSLCERVGDFDVRNLLEVAWGAHAIRRGEAKSVLVIDADDHSGGAAVLLGA